MVKDEGNLGARQKAKNMEAQKGKVCLESGKLYSVTEM